jgi:NAD(P)-dependent dehydrogenase (short-subunit alcohol dehydrogenase family)
MMAVSTLEGGCNMNRDKVVVVTGAQGVLGSAVVAAFAASGAHVAALDVASGGPSVGELRCTNFRVDVTDVQAARLTMTQIREQFGRIDVVANIAGGFQWESIVTGAIETWDRMYTLNLRTAVAASQAALSHLLDAAPGSRIINVAAAAAAKPAATGMGAYTASKAGIIKFTESLADEVKQRGLTVNAILPSIIDTPRNRADMPDEDFSKWVSPQEIAKVALFLASVEAQPITGASIPVTGRV